MKRVLLVVLSMSAALLVVIGLPPATSTAATPEFSVRVTNDDFTSSRCITTEVAVDGFLYGGGIPGEIRVYDPSGVLVGATTHESDEYSDGVSIRRCPASDPIGRYSVQVDGTEVGAFTIARPRITARLVHRHSRNAAVRGRLTLRGHPLAGKPVALQHLVHGTWRKVHLTKTGRYGYLIAHCGRRGKLPHACRGYWRFGDQNVVSSAAFHLPARTSGSRGHR